MDTPLSIEAAVERLCQLTGAPAKNQGDEICTGCPLCQGDTHHLYVRQGDSQALLIRCVKDESHGEAIIKQYFSNGARPNGKHPGGVTSRYEYRDREGILRYFSEVTRFPGGRKESRMGQPGPRGDRWDLHGVTPCLWHLPRLQGLPAGSLVLLPEGEKDVLALERAGFIASTNAGGCGGWKASLVEPLRPFRVAIPYDADRPGKRLADRKLVDLTSAGIDCRLIDLGYPVLPDHGKDVSDWLREHSPGELAALVQQAFLQPIKVTPESEGRVRIYTRAAIKALPPPEWQVDQMFEQQGLIIVFGPSGCGKTFFAASLALGLTTGRGWFGRETAAGPVCYVNADGGSGFAERVAAWEMEMGVEQPFEFLVVNEPINLFITHETIEFANQLKELPIEQRPKLIVFDTLARCMAGGDENATGDLGIVVRNLNFLQRELAATCMVVHHTGWSASDRMRGNSSLHAAADTVLRVAAFEGKHRVTCDKQRNATPFEPFEFRLQAQGESCVMRLIGASFSGSKPQIARKKEQERVMEVVANAEMAVAQFNDEAMRADWGLIRNSLSDLNTNTLKDYIQALLKEHRLATWNRPREGESKHYVYGITQRCEADCPKK